MDKNQEAVTPISDSEELLRGKQIVEFLELKPDRELSKNGVNLYKTSWGTKTELGLFRSLKRIIDGEWK